MLLLVGSHTAWPRSFPSKRPTLWPTRGPSLKSHRTFTGKGWVTYDTCFRRKAATSKSTKWGHIDLTLYNETFMGRAKALAQCCQPPAPATSILPRTSLTAQLCRNHEAHGLIQSAVSHQPAASYSTAVLAIGAPSIRANTVTHAPTVGAPERK